MICKVKPVTHELLSLNQERNITQLLSIQELLQTCKSTQETARRRSETLPEQLEEQRRERAKKKRNQSHRG